MNETHSPEADFGPEEPQVALATIPEAGLPVERLLAMAIQNGATVEALERLLAMRQTLKAEQAREAFFEALSAFQSECPVIRKQREAGTGNFTYRYAPLETIAQAIAPVLRRHGLSYRFNTQFESSPPAQVVTCIVNHRDGHQESSEFRTPVDSSARMNVMQQSASAQTYGRRYALLNALGITVGGEDDDGQGGAPSQGKRGVMPNEPATAAAPRHMTRGIDDEGAESVSASRGRPEASSRPVPSSPVPIPVGRNLVRISRPSTQLEQKVAEAQLDMSPLRREVVEMAMALLVQERLSRGQEAPEDEVIEPIAYDRCQEWLQKTYQTPLEVTTASQLEALRRVLHRQLEKYEEKVG